MINRTAKLTWLDQEIKKGEDDFRNGRYKAFRTIDALELYLDIFTEEELGG